MVVKNRKLSDVTNSDIVDGCFEFPKGITRIDECAFDECDELIKIVIPTGVTKIGNHAFNECTSLEEVIVPDTVTEIGYSAFSQCKSLRAITLPNGITEIENWLFEGCASLKSISFSKNVKEIGESVIAGCAELEEIIVEEGNEKYYSSGNCLIDKVTKTIIAGCKTSVIPVDEGIRTIGPHAFDGCIGLRNVVIPETVGAIMFAAFSHCPNLENINIPSSVELIDDYAFSESGLLSVRIPSSATNLGDWLFSGCEKLEKAKFEEGCEFVPPCCFCCCRNLKDVVLPDSITSISLMAFVECISLEKVVLPQHLETIVADAFRDCKRLHNIKIPKSVNWIGSGAFCRCKSLCKKGLYIVTDTNMVVGKTQFVFGVDNVGKFKTDWLKNGFYYFENAFDLLNLKDCHSLGKSFRIFEVEVSDLIFEGARDVYYDYTTKACRCIKPVREITSYAELLNKPKK